MSSKAIPGLHHVTAISGPPQSNADFYTGALKQRLVKRTVNFDDPGTYHLYYGDDAGTPGSILTFFPFEGVGPGKSGPGMASAFSYAVPKGGLASWTEHLQDKGVETGEPIERFGERVLVLSDPDGLTVELIETEDAKADRDDDGFHSVTLWLDRIEPTARILADVMGYEEHGQERDPDGKQRLRLRSPEGGRGAVVDLIRSDNASSGRSGAGTIHHVAFRAETPEVQKDWQERVSSAGLDVTPVIDRQYFDAIYFREPGGVLFEIATDPPGFATDEPAETMGSKLMLPPQYEPHRDRIEAVLPPLSVPVR